MTSSGGEEGERTRPRGARDAIASSLPPSVRVPSEHAACFELSVAQREAKDLRGMRSASPRVQEEGSKGRMEEMHNFRREEGRMHFALEPNLESAYVRVPTYHP